MTSDRTAIVIGSGFGGLALAIRLQSAGIATTLLEARDKPGGRAYVFEQDGFRFDAGPTVLTAPGVIDELFALSGRNRADYIEFETLTPFYRLLWQDGTSFDYVGDEQVLEQTIAAMSPDDIDGYRRFRQYSADVFVEGYEKLAHVPFLNIWSMVRVAPELHQARELSLRVQHRREIHQGRQTAPGVQLSHAARRRQSVFTTSAMYALIHTWNSNGACISRAAAPVRSSPRSSGCSADLGGTLRLNAKVDEILTGDDGRVTGVRLADGEIL